MHHIPCTFQGLRRDKNITIITKQDEKRKIEIRRKMSETIFFLTRFDDSWRGESKENRRVVNFPGVNYNTLFLVIFWGNLFLYLSIREILFLCSLYVCTWFLCSNIPTSLYTCTAINKYTSTWSLLLFWSQTTQLLHFFRTEVLEACKAINSNFILCI